MARLTLDKVLTRVFDSHDNRDDFGHLDSESEEEEYKGVSAYIYLPAAVRPGEAGSA